MMRAKSKIMQYSLICGIIMELLLPTFAFLAGPKSSTLMTATNPQSAVIPIEIPEELRAQGITKPTQLPNAGFIENQGQIDAEDCQYYLSVGETVIYFGMSKISFFNVAEQEDTEELSVTTYSVEFPGGAIIAPVGIDVNTYSVNYITDAGLWTDVPSFNAIVYSAIYAGIDLKYFLSDEGLKYEFLVHAGADPSQIIIALNGVGSLTVLPTEVTSDGSFRDQNLVVYQVDETIVNASFMAAPSGASNYAFQLGAYDPTQDLVIDPLVIEFSSYLGGNQDEGLAGSVAFKNGLFIDASGYIYITGMTLSTNFPMVNNLSGYVGNWDLFVTKLTPDCSAIVYSTYIGGSANEWVGGIQVDGEGNAYVTGSTYSTNFPTVNAFQTDPGDGTTYEDVIMFKLNSTGNGLNYSTYIGGNGQDGGEALAIDSAGNAYIAGYSFTSDYPLKNEYQGFNGLECNAILTKLNSTGNGLVFSTAFGGTTTGDFAEGIALDAFGNIYICGQFQIYGSASNFPLKNAWDNSAPLNNLEGYIACFNSTGNGLNFSTYVGGSDDDWIRDLKLGSDGCIYAAGYTYSSSDFPLVNAYQATFGGGTQDIILVKLNATGDGAVFSTYFGGNGYDFTNHFSLTTENEIVVAGDTTSTNLVPVQAYQASYQGGTQDAFVAQFTTNASSNKFTSYLGGTAYDHVWDLWVDDQNCTYIVGETNSTNFPTRNPYQGNKEGGKDAFITKMLLDEAPVISPASDFSFPEYTSGNQINWTITDALTNNGNYTVFKNGSGWETHVDQSWTSPLELHVNVDALTKGVYNFTILVDDGYGLTATDEVIVNVTGESPIIVGSSDFSYYVDTTGHQINWTVIDDSVGTTANYSVLRNDSTWGTYDELPWSSGVELHVNVDGLPVGLHNFTIQAFDGTGLNRTDEVFVTVLKRTTNGTWQDIVLGNQFITCYEMEVNFAETFLQGVIISSHIKITAYTFNPTTSALADGVRYFTIELDNPNGVNFPATVKFYYDDSQLPEGVSEESLGIYHLEDGQWVSQGGIINKDLNTITLNCNSFSDFAIAPIPQTPPWDWPLTISIILIAVIALLIMLYFKMRGKKVKPNEQPDTFDDLFDDI